MKHPLTSKERRGLVALAAAALLCIGAGFIFRNCGSRNAPASVIVIDNDSVKTEGTDTSKFSENPELLRKSEKTGKSRKSDKSGKDSVNGKRARRAKRANKKTAPERTYPTREPLDEPIYSND